MSRNQRKGSMRETPVHLRWWRRGTCALILALACIFTPAAAVSETAPDHVLQGSPTTTLALSPADTIASAQANRLNRLKKKDGSCKLQLRDRARTFSPCEYFGAYKSAERNKPKLIKGLAPPGRAYADDRKILFWRTNPDEYKLMKLESEAGKWYKSPRAWLWYQVNDDECRDTWNCNTGNGYYGGLQMDRSFQQTNNPKAYALWGTANNWPVGAQMLAADRAYAVRGLQPWPTSHGKHGTRPAG